jgi:predicted O-methyltransferase YrrM
MAVESETQSLLNVEFFTPTDTENKILEQLDDSYTKISEMTFEERAFLNGLVLRKQPKKLLEIGVSSGGSSIVLLNAIKDIANAKLYSIDLNENCYLNKFKIGYFVDNYQSLKQKWELFTGDMAYKFMEKIGTGIDFCFIDTAHVNPGEIFDFLMVLPFLDNDAIVVLHDVALHTSCFLRKKYGSEKMKITNNLLMSSITGDKILQGNYKKRDGDIRVKSFPNIAGIKINTSTKENIFEIFNLLMITWYYLPTDNQEKEIIYFLGKYYHKYYIDYLLDIFRYQKSLISIDKGPRIKNIIKEIIGKENISKIMKLLNR